MTIRKYRSEDREQLIALWKTAFPDDPPHNEPASMLDAKLKVDDLVFLADIGNRVVGACMAGYDGHRGWLYGVAVLPEYRREGIGAKVVRAAINELKSIGCVKVNLQIRAGNYPVQEFYEKLGFLVEERQSMGVLL